jgi:hypothetical protein
MLIRLSNIRLSNIILSNTPAAMIDEPSRVCAINRVDERDNEVTIFPYSNSRNQPHHRDPDRSARDDCEILKMILLQ